MKTSTLLTLLTTAAASTSAATVPIRARDGAAQTQSPHRLALLHTLTPTRPPPSRLLALSAADEDTESTKGGAILSLPSSNTNNPLTSAHATIRIPHSTPPTHGPTANNPVGVYAAAFWVGIDSLTSENAPRCEGGGASLRAGVDVFWDGTFGGVQTPFAWFQLAPVMGEAVGFGEGFEVAEGDLVRFVLEGGSSANGGEGGEMAVVAENFGGNVTCVGQGAVPVQRVRQVLERGEVKLCGEEAAWVVEDFPLAGLPDFPVALTNFTSVAFGGAGVTLADGTARDVSEAEVFDISLEAQGGRLTSCEVVDGKKVKCDRAVGDE